MSKEYPKQYKEELKKKIYDEIKKVYDAYFAEYKTLEKGPQKMEENNDGNISLILRQLILHDARQELEKIKG